MVDYAQIGERDVVLEIGPGRGMLTREILNSPCSFLHIIEIDKTLAPFLEPLLKRHETRTSLIWGDVLTVNLKELSPSPTKVLANIPYNITTPLIWQILEHLAPMGTKELILMLQLDLAERLCAKPGTKDRSPLGITIERMGQVQIAKKSASISILARSEGRVGHRPDTARQKLRPGVEATLEEAAESCLCKKAQDANE